MRALQKLAAIALVAAVASACGGAATKPAASASAAQAASGIAVKGSDGIQRVRIDGTDSLQFSPNVIKASTGTLVITFDIPGSTPHTLAFAEFGLDTGYVAGGSHASLTLHLTKPGNYPFTCDYHPGMTGMLEVHA